MRFLIFVWITLAVAAAGYAHLFWLLTWIGLGCAAAAFIARRAGGGSSRAPEARAWAAWRSSSSSSRSGPS